MASIEKAIVKASTHLGDRGKIIISHPRGFDNVVQQRSMNNWLVPSLLPISSELEALSAEINMLVTHKPDSKSPQYLAVLEKIQNT